MATLTIRNLPAAMIVALKRLASHHNRSMEQEVRAILQEKVMDRTAVLEEVEAARKRNTRTATPAEVRNWLGRGNT
jgi:plasmid stability protein